MAYTSVQIAVVEAKIAALNVKKFSALGLSVDEVAELDGLLKQLTHMNMNTGATIVCGPGKVYGVDG